MTPPARYDRQGTADAGPARLGPTAGRRAPVSWQQVNSARPRPRGAPPASVRAAWRRPRVPVPRGVFDARGAAGGLGVWVLRPLGGWLPPNPAGIPGACRLSEKRGEVPDLRPFSGEGRGGSPVRGRNGRGGAASG